MSLYHFVKIDLTLTINPQAPHVCICAQYKTDRQDC